jgi:hypothetical protein
MRRYAPWRASFRNIALGGQRLAAVSNAHLRPHFFQGVYEAVCGAKNPLPLRASEPRRFFRVYEAPVGERIRFLAGAAQKRFR